MRQAVRQTAWAALACLSLAPLAPALAGPADYLFSPLVEKGEREIEMKAGTAKNRDGTRETEWRLSIGYGFTDWWFSEIGANWHKVPGQGRDFDAWEWENRFHLFKAEHAPVDVGFLLEIERPRDRSEGYEYRWGPLLQADLGPKLTANLNLLIEKRIRTQNSQRAELGYQWQLRYHWREEFEFGVQGFGDVGPWDHWESSSQQSHILGPALFGEIKVFGDHEIKYNAGVLFGVTHGSPRNTLRMQAEYEF